MRKLATEFFDVKKTSKQKNSIILYMVDGSGSISASNFDTFLDGKPTIGPLKEGLISIFSVFPSTTLQAVAQFSTETRLESGPVKDINTLINVVRAMKQMGECTYTKEAMLFAQKFFSQYSEYDRNMILITDGLPSTTEQYPDTVIDALKAMGVNIIVIGVGDVKILPNDKLSKWSSSKTAWNLSNWQDFQQEMEMIKQIQDEESASQDPLLTIDAWPIRTSLRSGENFPLELGIRPLKQDVIVPKGLRITFNPKDTYFEGLQIITTEEARYGSSTKQSVTLIRRANAQESDFKGQISYTYTMQYKLPTSSKVITVSQTGKIILPTGLLRGDFETPFPINCLVFGQRGNGKSATVNCLLTCISMEHQPIRALIVRGPDVTKHTTSNYQKIWAGDLLTQHCHPMANPDLLAARDRIKPDLKRDEDSLGKLRIELIANPKIAKDVTALKKIVDQKKSQINLIDQMIAEGIEKDKESLKNEYHKCLLHFFDPWGTAKDTYTQGGVQKEHFLSGKVKPGAPMDKVEDFTSLVANLANKIHVIIFIFPLTMIDDNVKTTELINLWKDVQQSSAGAYDPIMVVTHIDDFENQKDRDPLYQQIRNTFTGGQIYFHCNYTNEESRKAEIDLSSRAILQGILHRWNNYKAAHPEYFKGVQWQNETVLGSTVRRYCMNKTCDRAGYPQTENECVKCHGPTTLNPDSSVTGKSNPIPPNPSNEPIDVTICFESLEEIIGAVQIEDHKKISDLRISININIEDEKLKSKFWFKDSSGEKVKDEKSVTVSDIIDENNNIIITNQTDNSDSISIYNTLNECLGCINIDEDSLGETLRNEIIKQLGIEFNQFMKQGRIPIGRNQENKIISQTKSMWVITEDEKKIILRQ